MVTGGVNGGPCVSGTADCPCCGYPTMVADWRVPELCPECVAHDCDVYEVCSVPTDAWPYDTDQRD